VLSSNDVSAEGRIYRQCKKKERERYAFAPIKKQERIVKPSLSKAVFGGKNM